MPPQEKIHDAELVATLSSPLPQILPCARFWSEDFKMESCPPAHPTPLCCTSLLLSFETQSSCSILRPSPRWREKAVQSTISLSFSLSPLAPLPMASIPLLWERSSGCHPFTPISIFWRSTPTAIPTTSSVVGITVSSRALLSHPPSRC